jgi:hypothetical protein
MTQLIPRKRKRRSSVPESIDRAKSAQKSESSLEENDERRSGQKEGSRERNDNQDCYEKPNDGLAQSPTGREGKARQLGCKRTGH